MQIVGLDCGRGNVTACIIREPINNLKEFARSYKPLIFKSNREELEKLAALGDVFAIEPTGADHRIFVNYLERQGKLVLLCTGDRIRSHARTRGLVNKKDREDAAAIADYTIRAINGEGISNPFVTISGEEIRQTYSALGSLNRAKSPIINQLWSRLAFEFPEFLHTEKGTVRKVARREWLDPNPPKPWRWIAEELEYPKLSTALEQTIGSGLSSLTRSLAVQLCQIERQELALEQELEQHLKKVEPFYHTAFDKWNIPQRSRAALLCSCYPIEKFLSDDGKPIREYTPAVSENAKRSKTFRDRSLKRFMLHVGMGRIISESGRSKGDWVMGGSKSTRSAIFLLIKTLVVMPKERAAKPRQRKDETKEAFKARLKNFQSFKEFVKELNQHLYKPNVDPWNNSEIIAAVVERNKVCEGIASLQIYYEMSPNCANIPEQKRIMKIASKFSRALYREILKQRKLALKIF